MLAAVAQLPCDGLATAAETLCTSIAASTYRSDFARLRSAIFAQAPGLPPTGLFGPRLGILI